MLSYAAVIMLLRLQIFNIIVEQGDGFAFCEVKR